LDKIHSLRGMNDLIGQKVDKDNISDRIFFTEKILRNLFENYCLSEIRTPALEEENLFKRSVGDSSDIVNKELYSFLDKNEKRITLRPEGTAGVIRSIIEKKIDGDAHRLWYLGPMWRYERPQKGRYRQFYQAGIEILGYEEGLAELEMISLICSINKQLEIQNSVIKINHLGNNEYKNLFCKELVSYLKPFSSKLDKKDLERLDRNPLRILDSKNSETQNILKEAPKISDHLPQESLDLLDLIRDTFSNDCNIEIDHKLVRGLDYYTDTAFEFQTNEDKRQNAILAGGRYDKLISLISTRDIPGIGWAAGVERLMSLINIENQKEENFKVLFAVQNEKYLLKSEILKQIYELDCIHEIKINKNIKKIFTYADKNNFNFILLIGEEEDSKNKIILKNLNTKEQKIFNQSDIKIVNEIR